MPAPTRPAARVAGPFATAVEAVPAAVCLLAVVLVLLLDAHQFRPGLIYPLGGLALVTGVVGTSVLRARTTGVERPDRLGWLWDLLALAGALLSAGVNAAFDSQHLVVDRDPGIYVTTAKYLTYARGLPVRVDVGGFAPGAVIPAMGYGPTHTNGELWAQGMHGVPALAAVSGRLFGDAALLRTDAVLGAVSLLAFYAFARLVVGRPWALVAVAGLALSLPQIHFTRDTYSESLGQLAAWLGLAAFVRARALGARWAALFAGVLFGATMLSRTDAFLAVLAAAAGAVVLTIGAVRAERRAATGRAVAWAAGVAIPTVIGLRDLQRGASGYYHDLHGQLTGVFAADLGGVVLAVLAVLVAWYAPPVRDLYLRLRRPLGLVVAGALALVFVYLGLRPFTTVSRGASSSFIAALERQQGLPVDPTRTYSEHAVAWVTYYLGPLTVALGLLGVVVASWRLVARRELWLLPYLALFLPVAVGYFYSPSIYADQIWGVRRFLAVVIPGLLLGLAMCLEWLFRRRSDRAPWVRPVAGAVAVVVGAATVGVPLAVSHPLLRVREYVPDLRLTQRFCAALRPDAEVLGVEDRAGFPAAYQPTITSYCRVPAARLVVPVLTAQAVVEQQTAAAAAGRTLYVWSAATAVLGSLVPPDTPPTFAVNERQWRSELTEAPSAADVLPRRIYLFEVGPGGVLRAVPPAQV